MRRMRTTALLAVVHLFLTLHAYSQGTVSILRCSFKGTLDVHARREPSSPIVARVGCGDPLLLIDQSSGSPHVRTEDGKEGYIISMNSGQWSIEPQSGASLTARTSPPGSSTPAPVRTATTDASPTPQPQTQRVSDLISVQSPPPSAAGAQPVNQLGQNSSASLLTDGMPIRLRLNRNVSSADAKVGESVDFEVLDEIKITDVVVVPKSATALATVTEAQSKRSMGRGGKLNVNIDHVRLADGEKVPLRAIKENQGGGHVGAMTGAIVATSIVFFPAAPLFLFMKGKDITIPKGTEVTAYVNGDFTVDLGKFRQKLPDQSPASFQSLTVSNDFVQVAINSVPDGADIMIDGKFVGNTPANLRLRAGEHVISIEKSGFKVWQRSISTTAGSNLTIAPTLDKLP